MKAILPVAPELPECSAFGELRSALKQIKVAIDLFLVTEKEDRREIP